MKLRNLFSVLLMMWLASASAFADFKTIAPADLNNLLTQSTMPSLVVRGAKESADRQRLVQLVGSQGQIYAGLVQLVIVDDDPASGQDAKPACVEAYLPATTVPVKVVQFPCGSAAIDELFNLLLPPVPSQSTPNNHCPL